MPTDPDAAAFDLNYNANKTAGVLTFATGRQAVNDATLTFSGADLSHIRIKEAQCTATGTLLTCDIGALDMNKRYEVSVPGADWAEVTYTRPNGVQYKLTADETEAARQ
ncbi:hypothetical protein [Deinococcus sp.]|uniref:hypothetical protein n=1 Tax=Deinococcus sp. TaxID=47478 RepID=UPI0025BEF842|nr:hypothetical protein [Deinococcus sp.]